MNAQGDSSGYSNRLEAEKKHFDDPNTNDLPGIYYYWSDKWILPKLRAFGIAGAAEMFEKYLSAHCERSDSQQKFVSIGSGSCDLEIDLAQRLRKRGYTHFTIECLELNSGLLDKARAVAELAGIANNLAFIETDLNEWRSNKAYDVVLASHSLHHVLNLENVFNEVRRALAPGGQFVVSDVIGRNGHMRWPEALDIVHEFWKELPEAYRFNALLKRHEDVYENWDCSSEGFEGIRAQEILPMLLERFHFEFFAAFGNVIMPFVDRAFGPNFNPQGQWDREFIDRVHLRDEEEMLAGRVKPTIVMAVMGLDTPVPTQYLAPFSPQFCVRWPDRQPSKSSPNPASENIELKQRIETMGRELGQAKEAFEIAKWKIDQAAQSSWLKLGRRFGLGPKLP